MLTGMERTDLLIEVAISWRARLRILLYGEVIMRIGFRDERIPDEIRVQPDTKPSAFWSRLTDSCHTSGMKYRVFTNDVGPNQFSALREIDARFDDEALLKGVRDCNGLPSGTKILVLSEQRRDLWPNGKTGRVPKEALDKHLAVIE